MGAIGGLLGLSGGANGSGYAAPTGTNIVNPTSPEQIAASQAGTQNSMQSQQALLAALQGQNGLGNQSQVYNQLQGVANGTGPNPAQAMLNQQTGTNVANQAALMAGQRGAASNVGLMARQAAQQGAGIQQNAVGQAATMQANQSLNALNQAGNMANTMASNQVGQTNANTAAQQANQAQQYGAQQGVNTANVGMQSNINNANASLANTNMQGQQGIIGGIASGVGSALGLAQGGEASAPVKMADGGDPFQGSGPQSSFGQYLSQIPSPEPINPGAPLQFAPDAGAAALKSGIAKSFPKKPGGSPMGGTQTLAGGPMDNMGGADAAGAAGGTDLMAAAGPALMVAAKGGEADYRSGGKVNAKNASQKASVPGNSYQNDQIPAILSEKEIVLPRSVTMSADPVNNAARFVQQVLAQRKNKR